MLTNKQDFFYRGIAKPVSLKESDEVILKKAGMAWEPLKRDYLFSRDNKDFQKSCYVDSVYRSDNGKEIAAVTKNWNVYSNYKMLQDVRLFCERSGFQLEAAGVASSAAGNGSIGGFLVPFFSVLLKTNRKNLGVGEEISQHLIFANPIAQNQGIFAELVSLRLICTNGAVLPKKLKQVSIAHSSPKIDEKVEKLLNSILLAEDQYLKELEILADTPLTEEAAMVILTKLFGHTDRLWEQQTRSTRCMFDIFTGEYDQTFAEHGIDLGQSSLACFKTGYGLYNAVTAYNSHFRGYAHATSNSAFLSMVRGNAARDNRKAFSEISSWASKVREKRQMVVV